MADPDDDPTELGTNEARAGTELGVMRYVLGISMVLIIVVFLFLFWR